jgi:hypothetical protein
LTTIVERAGAATSTTTTEDPETETIIEVAARNPTATAIAQGLATDESGAVPAPPTRAGGATAAGTVTEIATEDEIDHATTTATTTTTTTTTRHTDADATVIAPKTTMMIKHPHKNHAAAP